jgi:branched-chain amino acid transport system ATP-binding protein
VSALLVVAGVSAGYSSVPVLDAVSLRAQAGEIVAVLGANGAGKTTLFRLISGLMTARGGEITLDGEPITHLRAHQIARLGVAQVIEERGVLPSLTVRENVLLGMFGLGRVTRKAQTEAIERAVDLFPWMGQRLDSYGGQLSGGEQQMVALSRAVATQPRVLLLDEPSLGVAPVLVDEIYDKIRLLVEGSRTVLIVEQQIRRALSVASRAYVLRRGTVVLEGDTADLVDDPRLAEAYFS